MNFPMVVRVIAVDPRRPDAFEVEERPERGEDRDQVQEERDDSLQPMHLKRAVMPEEVETAHHERIPESHRRTSHLKHPCTRPSALTNRGHSDRPSFITDQRRFNHHGGIGRNADAGHTFCAQVPELATRYDTYMAHAPLPRHP